MGAHQDDLEKELPEGWAHASISSFTTKVGSGSTPRGGSEVYVAEGVPLVRSQNIHFAGFSDEGLAYIGTAHADALKEVTLQERDVLLNITGASIGRVCCAPNRMEGARVNQHVSIIRPLKEVVDPHFLSLLLRSPEFQARINSEEYGVTRQALTKDWICNLEVPVPPIAEQKRIVEHVEGLLGRVDAAWEKLNRVPAILKRLRQSVLAAACSGRLTEDWRRAKRGVEEAPRLLERIGATIVEGVAENVFSHLDDSALFDLPETWAWSSLGSLGRWSGGGTPTKARAEFWNDGTVPWVTPKDMKVFTIGDSQDHITEAGVEGARLKIAPPGSLLMVVRGMILAHTFPVAITTKSVTVNQDMRVLQPHEGAMGPFLLLALQQASGGLLNEVKESTHGTKRLESGSLLNFPIAIPPIEEEFEIVRRVQGVFRLLGEVEMKIEAGVVCAEKLTQAILAKAIRGELVPTEAEMARREGRDYEPASSLLARVAGLKQAGRNFGGSKGSVRPSKVRTSR